MKNLLSLLFLLAIAQGAFACSATAGFSNTNTSSGNNLLQVTFTNSSSVTSLSSVQYAQYEVYFGDGTHAFVGYNGSVAHNYSTAGTYTASMVARGIDSSSSSIVCSDSITTSVTVSYPNCGSTISVSYGTAGAATLTATTPAATSGMSYSWDYGDTQTGTGSPTTHTYAANGYYTVTLTATSGLPCSWTSTLQIHITTVAPTVNCSVASVAFTSSVSANNATFTSSITPPTASIYLAQQESWHYGDGSTGTSANHTYSSVGTYTVCLYVTWFDSANMSTPLCTDSICHNVTITSAPNVITGTLYYDSSCMTTGPNYKVWLITYNASTLNLAAVDSVSLTYPTHTFSFSSPAAGTYRVKSWVTNATSSPAPLPTYGLDSLHWNTADSFAYTSGTSSGHDIHLPCGTAVSGPGFIGGNVTLGANKGTKVTNGQPGVEILISSSIGNISYTTTNSNGDYSFANLPVPGTYTIYPEVLGYHNNPWIVTLTAANETVNNASFHIATNPKTTTTTTTTGIENINTVNNTVLVYPNPSTGIVNITCTETAHAIVSDVVGHKVFETNINSGNNQMNLSSLKAGIYFINIKADNINYSSKIVLQR